MRSISILIRLPALAVTGLIKFYRHTFSALIGRQCRYLPTCSEFTEEAIDRFGLWPGVWMGLARFQRCGPGGASGYDPVPANIPVGAAWFCPWRYGHWRGDHIDPKTRLDI